MVPSAYHHVGVHQERISFVQNQLYSYFMYNDSMDFWAMQFVFRHLLLLKPPSSLFSSERAIERERGSEREREAEKDSWKRKVIYFQLYSHIHSPKSSVLGVRKLHFCINFKMHICAWNKRPLKVRLYIEPYCNYRCEHYSVGVAVVVMVHIYDFRGEAKNKCIKISNDSYWQGRL